MTRVDEFDAFYHDSRRQVLHQTYALTGDLTAAILAVQDAYAHAWQHWTKLRLGDPLGQVRPEAMRIAGLRRGTQLLRRKRRADTDSELLTALASLTTTARRLVLLQAVGGLDLAGAAREVGMTPDDAFEVTDRAVTDLEDALGASTGQVERRLDELRRITDAASLPRASIIRRSGTRRKHRNTLVAIVASAAVIMSAGYVVTAPSDGRAEGLHPEREQFGQERTEEDPVGASEEQLLSASHVVRLDANRTWTETGTSTDLDALEPYATCARARYGTTQLRQAFVRTFEASGKTQQTAVEAIEVANTKPAARSSYVTQLSWYAGCQVPRVQLLDAYAANRHGTDLRIVQLRKWSNPVRTITVGLARSGFVTSTFVHQIEGPTGPRLATFATALDDSLGLLCGSTGGMCQLAGQVHSVAPPVVGPPGFLGEVDLPPVANLAKVWAATPPVQTKQNLSATSCDKAEYNGDGVSDVRTRFYVVPEARHLPSETFGISETIATFNSEEGARAYLKRIEERMRKCEDRNLAARVRGPGRIGQGAVKVRSWWLSLETGPEKSVEYRLALVRNGSRIAQVLFTPVGRFDVTGRSFNKLAIRAGHRLAELE